MQEIKVVIGKNGKTKILAGGTSGKGTAKFTEELADELGNTEERHKGTTHEKLDQQNKNQAKQGQG